MRELRSKLKDVLVLVTLHEATCDTAKKKPLKRSIDSILNQITGVPELQAENVRLKEILLKIADFMNSDYDDGAIVVKTHNLLKTLDHE